jgi:hypothetical protein
VRTGLGGADTNSAGIDRYCLTVLDGGARMAQWKSKLARCQYRCTLGDLFLEPIYDVPILEAPCWHMASALVSLAQLEGRGVSLRLDRVVHCVAGHAASPVGHQARGFLQLSCWRQPLNVSTQTSVSLLLLVCLHWMVAARLHAHASVGITRQWHRVSTGSVLKPAVT